MKKHKLAFFNHFEIYKQLSSVLSRMDFRREALQSKFRPIMMVFAFYGLFCLIFPYANFGVPYAVKSNLFIFLIIVGGLAFIIVAITYRQQYSTLDKSLRKELSQAINQRLDDNEDQINPEGNTLSLSPVNKGWVVVDFRKDLSVPNKHKAVSYHLEIDSQLPKDSWRMSSIEGLYFHFDVNIEAEVALQVLPLDTPIDVFSNRAFKEININSRFYSSTGSEESDLLVKGLMDCIIDLCDSLKGLGLIKHDLHFHLENSSLQVMLLKSLRLGDFLSWKSWDNAEFVYSELVALDKLLSLCSLIEQGNTKLLNP